MKLGFDGVGRLLRAGTAASSPPLAEIALSPPLLSAPSGLVDYHPRILTPEDGIAIAESFRDYVLLIASGPDVTVYVEEGCVDSPALGSIQTSLERRSHLYRSIAITPVTLEKIERLKRAQDQATTHTVPGERLVIQLLRLCADLRATDIQLKQYRHGAGVELRIDGDMVPNVQTASKGDLKDCCTALWNMSDGNSRLGNYSEMASASASIVHNLKQYGLDDLFAAIRLSFNFTFLGPECSIRLQPAGQTARPLEDLGLPAPAIIAFRRATSGAEGALLISGPMGSGKSNLLASIVLDYHDRRPQKKILTIEDPVEIFIADRISQWAVTGFAGDRAKEYEDLLHRALRADAQMLMLQECRDAAAASAFIEASITGAIGLTTIHTPNAMKIIRRLAGWNIEEAILTDPEIIRLLGAVRLVTVLCDCKIPIELAIKSRNGCAAALADSVGRLQRHADHSYFLRGQEVPRLICGFTRNHEGCELCQRRSKIRKTSYGITGRAQLAEAIAPDGTLLEQLYKGRLDEAHHHVRAILRVPSIQEDAIDRIVAGRLCPLDAELALGLFEDPKQLTARSAGVAR
jgi:type II secretory ATPase GspE/PulE/Tfp pilus assembly ATPase PilB-like protein